eukprot:3008200-Pleurochrysis_carterae.AAC.2
MVHSVLLNAKQVKELCCFHAVAGNGMGREHVRVVSCRGDLRFVHLRFVRSVSIRFVHSAGSAGKNARGCVARFEMSMSVWEVN